MRLTRIAAIQGAGLRSPLAGQQVRTRGVVTGATRKGFFLQDPENPGATRGGCSRAVFVFTRRGHPPVGAAIEVEGTVIDYLAHEHDRPTTQIVPETTTILDATGPAIEPVWLTPDLLDCDLPELAGRLTALEAMLVGVEAGAAFSAGSNPFGDYVLAPEGLDVTRTPDGGVLIDPERPHRWLPGFRIIDYDLAPIVNVGARLRQPVFGPLNYRASSFQIAARVRPDIEPRDVDPTTTTFHPAGPRVTVLTLNGFNLDPHVERAWMVDDRHRDIDDDIGAGRYRALAHAIVHRGASPDIIALQEIQDDDGAEITGRTSARRSYEELVRAIERQGGPTYAWADLPPVAGADGGQPGGNIRNGFLYNPGRVELLEGTLRRLGETEAAFDESRKPLVAHFRHRSTGGRIAIFNVHLASKRHQFPIFAPERAGFDPRARIRVEQAGLIRRELLSLHRDGQDYYVTGDFNDFEFSPTLRTLVGEESVNLVERLAADGRYDYNHRGISEALLHAVVPRRMADDGGAEYEILHGNELLGVPPGQEGSRPTDHAYGIARLKVVPS